MDTEGGGRPGTIIYANGDEGDYDVRFARGGMGAVSVTRQVMERVVG